MKNILERISKIAENEGITMTGLEAVIGASKGVLSRAVKNGTDIQSKWIVKIVENYPQYSSWILTGDDNDINNLNLNDDESIYTDDYKEPETFINERTGNKYLIYPDGNIRIEVIKIPFAAHASYIECFEDEVKLNQEFSTITFKVDHIGRGKYLGFESKGNSMWNNGGYDTPSGADILGREIGRHLWQYGFKKIKYGFILITKTGIYHKDIESLDENGHLLLTSRNPENSAFKYPINDVKEIYSVIKRSF